MPGTVTGLLDLARRRPALAIFVLALSVRTAWVATLGDTLYWPDEREYVDIARHLVAGDGYVSTSYRANPILPFYLGGVFSIFGESYLAARIGQAVFGALTCVLVYRTATLLAGRRVGIVSAVLLAVYLPHIYLSGVFYVECVFGLLISLAIYLAAQVAVGVGRVGTALLCGLACGATILTRPIFAVYVPLICVAWIICAWPRWRPQLPLCAAVLLAAVTTVLPWSVRNSAVFGRVLPVSSGFYTTLWQGNNPLAVGNADDRLLFPGNRYWTKRVARLSDEERLALAPYDEIGRRSRSIRRQGGDWYLATDAAMKPVVLEYLREHPGQVAWLVVQRLRTLFSPFTPTDTANTFTSQRNRFLAGLAFYPMLALALVGAWRGMHGPRAIWLLYFFVASLTASYALLTACTRFRLPLDPYLIVFSGMALVHFWSVWLSPARRRFAIPPLRGVAHLDAAMRAEVQTDSGAGTVSGTDPRRHAHH